MTSVLIVGVGGQGSIFAARVLGQTAMLQGLHVRGSETIGMAQRGGSVASHVRMSETEIASPLISPGSADVLLALEPSEGRRALHVLRVGGLYVLLTCAQKEAVLQQCGAKSLNAAVLGLAAARGAFPFDEDCLAQTLQSFGRPAFAEQNIRALRLGANFAKEISQ